MKKFIYTITLVVASVFGAQAQTSSDVQLNIVLNPLRTLTVANNSTVDLEFNTAKDYEDGVSKTIDNQLKVTSVGSGYSITAKSSATNPSNSLTQLNGDYISVAIFGGQGVSSAAQSLKSLNASDVVSLYTDDKSVVNESLHVTYAANLGNKENYYDKLDGFKQTIFSTVITYTIETN